MKEYVNKKLIDYYDNIANEILQDKENARRENFFPRMIDKLQFDNFVEIGVDKGDFSKCILSKSKIQSFYGVDPWIDNFGSNHRPGYFDPKGENRMQTARDNLSSYGSRVNLIKDYSIEAAKRFENETIDCCYIDGDHSLEVLFDLYAWIPKVRYGGIMAFDDYKDGPNSGMKNHFGEQLPFRVKTALDFFCDKYGFKLNLVNGNRVPNAWFVKNRKTI